jgi:hypothetical protein
MGTSLPSKGGRVLSESDGGRARRAGPRREKKLSGKSGGLMVETLECRAGHEWTRESRRGRKPVWCPEHRESVRQTGEALSEAELIEIMERSARKGSLKAATWLLERRWPERWAPVAARARAVVSDEQQQEPTDPFAALDELAVRREARPAAG